MTPRRPGLVVTLYNWSRPRDLAHYEDFEHYHATFYRQVEALSVTPYTRRALDRGDAATFVAAVRNAADDSSRNLDAHDVALDGPVVAQDVDRMLGPRRSGRRRPRPRVPGGAAGAAQGRMARADRRREQLGYETARTSRST